MRSGTAMENKPAFLDTAYAYALVNTRDQWHARAVSWEQFLVGTQRRLLTTEFVLLEIADGLAALRFRSQAVRILQILQTSALLRLASTRTAFLSRTLGLQ
jgi:predicted nucleic acid-binding protein